MLKELTITRLILKQLKNILEALRLKNRIQVTLVPNITIFVTEVEK